MHGTRLRSTTAASANAISPAKKRSSTAANVSPSRRAVSNTTTSVSPRATTRSVSPGVHATTSPSRAGAPATSAAAGVSASQSPSALRYGSRVAGYAGGSSVAPSMEEALTGVGATYAANTGVSLSSFAHDGERFEPNTYETTFSFQGRYQHVAVAEATATLWCANESTGAIDLYSCVTGQYITSLQTLAEEVKARQEDMAEKAADTPFVGGSKKHTQSVSGGRKSLQTAVTPRSRGLVPLAAGGAAASPSARHRAATSVPYSPATAVTPTCLTATTSHMWVGYSDGTVAAYDALLLELVTMGQFHHTAVAALVVLLNGQVVSASADGLLVLWDTEAASFEAVTRVTVLLDAVREGAGALCAMTATSHPTRVCCGFQSGVVYSVFVASRPQEQTPAHVLKAHTGKINGLVVVRDLLFTAAEDNTVCVWYCGNPIASTTTGAVGTPNVRVASPPEALSVRALQNATKLVKRIPVQPCVRALLAETQTRSVWVAYADGLLERWSANADDDFGVEEIIDNALHKTAPRTVAGNEDSNNNNHSNNNNLSTEAGVAGPPSVKALLSLSAVQTMQWLALSSNGVNKVWYGHQNTLEMGLADSLLSLNEVISQDAEDTAAWREKVNVLRQKEMERKEKYICILEQLNEQRVLQRHYARWKQAVLFLGGRKKRAASLADTMEKRSQVQLVRRYFGKWATFYDAQQRHMRGYVLAMALSRTTERQQLHSCFVAWQSFLVKRRLAHTAQHSAEAMARMVNAARLSSFFHQWRSAASRGAQRKSGVSREHLALLAHKAQRQVQQRVLRQWIAQHTAATHKKIMVAPSAAETTTTTLTSPLSKFAAHYAKLQEERTARNVLQLWRRWTIKKTHYASLAAVAALREQQILYERRQTFFLLWRQRVHARHTRENAEQLSQLEAQLRKAEAEHGDIFEKLQLQKQLDQLWQQQASEEAQLSQTRQQLSALEQSCAQLRERQQQHQQERHRGPTSVSDTPLASSIVGGAHADPSMGSMQHPNAHNTSGSSGGGSGTLSSQPVSLTRLPGLDVLAQSTGPSTSVGAVSAGRGHMSANAVFYRSLVDQQRLSPIVLAHMPMDEAVYHVMGQLKGNVVNLYTDLMLFRQVKDRRRAGTSAVGILLEAFGELKRMIVSTVRGASATAASAAARSGMKATRWPLSMEALDCVPVHQCANVLSAIKTMVVAYDLLQPEDMPGVQSTCEELVANADWVFLIARACYLRRKPLPPVNNRQVV